MRSLLLPPAALLLAIAAIAAATARADQPPPAGALTELPGESACLALTNAGRPADGKCTLLRTSTGAAAVANDLAGADISPDGRNIYVVEEGDLDTGRGSTLMALSRDPAGGSIAQLPGGAGCVGAKGGHGCTRARGALGMTDVVVSPDGLNVYAVASEADAVLAFRRDPSTGAVKQLAGKAGCISGSLRGCAHGRALRFATGLRISPDGRNLYATGNSLAVLRRGGGGALRQPAGRPGCLAPPPHRHCGALVTRNEGLGGSVLSPDGHQLYTASSDLNDFTIFKRNGSSGALAASRRCIPYTRGGACRFTGEDQFISLAASPDGRNVYVVEGVTDQIDAFQREPLAGDVMRLSGSFGCNRSNPSACNGLSGAESLSFSNDSQVAYFALGGSGGVILYHRGPLGELVPFGGPYGCIADQGSCARGRGLRSAATVITSPDGRNAYVTGGESVAAFSVAPG